VISAPPRFPDPGDDYLLALAESEHAILVSGDQHLLTLADDLPIQTARAFLEQLDARPERVKTPGSLGQLQDRLRAYWFPAGFWFRFELPQGRHEDAASDMLMKTPDAVRQMSLYTIQVGSVRRRASNAWANVSAVRSSAVSGS